VLSQTHPLSPFPLTTDPNPNPKPNQVLLLLAFTTPMALLIWVGVFAELTVGLIKLAEGRQGASGPTEDLVDFGVLLLLQLMNALVCVDACAPGPAYCAYRPPACRARLRHGAAEARGSWRATVRTPYAYQPRAYRVPRTAAPTQALVGWHEECKAGDAVDALKKSLAPRANVKRNGRWIVVKGRELVRPHYGSTHHDNTQP